MPHPPSNWIDHLPRTHLAAEFSLWSADLTRMADDLARIDPFADVLHIDVADGHFAPALLFFPDLVAAIRKQSAKPLHVHLMAADPVILAQIDQFADAGADLISVHLENTGALDAALDRIAARGLAAGVVLKVRTPVADAARVLPRLRFLTLLGTEIGMKGQGLDPAAGDRLRDAERMIAGCAAKHRIILAADGGIRENTVPLLRAAGAESVVLGSLAFGAPDLTARMTWLNAL